MTGFWGWFLVFVVVAAIFNAEKLPALREFLEEKLKGSMEKAKEGSQIAKNKIKQVKTDIENKKNTPEEPEENTPEEIEESLKFMDTYIKEGENKKSKTGDKK